MKKVYERISLQIVESEVDCLSSVESMFVSHCDVKDPYDWLSEAESEW